MHYIFTFHFIYEGVSVYKFGCGEKNKVEPEKCKTGTIRTRCYCTGDKCVPPNPTDETKKEGGTFFIF